jgi:hypothetical protein
MLNELRVYVLCPQSSQISYHHLIGRHAFELQKFQLQKRRIDINSELVEDSFDCLSVILKSKKISGFLTFFFEALIFDDFTPGTAILFKNQII